MAATPPKNGESYVSRFANLGRSAPFFISTETGILENAGAAGIEVLVADKAFDGATALQNAQSFIQRDVDYVIEFRTDANFGPVIMQNLYAAGISVIAIAIDIPIPMPGATFFGANNPRSGFMGGSYLGQAAAAKWGPEEIAPGVLVVGELPQSSAIPAMRTNGQIAGFLAEHPEFPAENIQRIDTKGVLDEAFSVLNDLIGRIPEGKPIMSIAINDQSIMGMLRAVEQAGRSENAIFVGMGADEIDTLAGAPNFRASVGSVPENYGDYLVPMALMDLAGLELPPAVLVNHVMVTKGKVCEPYPDQPCAEGGEIAFEFPHEAFEAHLATLADDPALADHRDLTPSD